jgi:hypothetical protein
VEWEKGYLIQGIIAGIVIRKGRKSIKRLGIRYNEKVRKGKKRNNTLREIEGKEKETSLTTVKFWAEPRNKTLVASVLGCAARLRSGVFHSLIHPLEPGHKGIHLGKGKTNQVGNRACTEPSDCTPRYQ